MIQDFVDYFPKSLKEFERDDNQKQDIQSKNDRNRVLYYRRSN